ncbi:MAG TPA: Flp pilus assembly protein CpaB [Pirellulaceae bacterium]|nr:Flp pilus assembly protein CpaB [Pirellulaceae bacterium]HMO92086.1 Flp pilus assembly protein CpaB [Pirellulaceae bacterium]HMP69326.1 Flp pilus assembly protein CpaB [Pirellulaceae bacterium]
MKSKSVFLMAVSLGFGLIAAIGIRQVMGRSANSNQPSIEMMPVIVAAKDIEPSTEMTKEMVTVEMMPRQSVPEGAASKLEQVEGKITRARVGRRFAINLADLVDKSEVNTLAIPPGYKVVGINVSAEEHINGLLQPGDLVDIMGVFRQNQNHGAMAITFLKKVRVFSVDGALRAELGRDGKTKNTTVVSVLATQKQAEKLVLVQRMAELKLALLGPDAQNSIDYDAVVDSEFDQYETTLDQILSRQSNLGLQQFYQQKQPVTETASNPVVDEQAGSEFTMRIVTSNGMQTVKFGRNGEIVRDSGDFTVPTSIDNGASKYGDNGNDDHIDSDLFDDESDLELGN